MISTGIATSASKKRKSSEPLDCLATMDECQLALEGLEKDGLVEQDESRELLNSLEKVFSTISKIRGGERRRSTEENIHKQMLCYVDLGADSSTSACDRCRVDKHCVACAEYKRRMAIAVRINRSQTRLLDEITERVNALFDSACSGEEHDLFLGSMLENGAKVKASVTTRGSIRAITKQRVNRRKLDDLMKKRARVIMLAINTALDRPMFTEAK